MTRDVGKVSLESLLLSDRGTPLQPLTRNASRQTAAHPCSINLSAISVTGIGDENLRGGTTS